MYQQFRSYYYGRHSINYKCRVEIHRFISSNIGLPRFDSLMDLLYHGYTDPRSGTCINLSNLTKTLQNSIQGSMTSNRACSLMLLMNLAEPDWLFIPCQEKTLYYTVCVSKGTLKLFPKYHLLDYKILNGKHCDTLDLLILDACYAFVWQENILVQPNFCGHSKGKASYLAEFKHLRHFFTTFPAGMKTPIIFLKHMLSPIVATKVMFETFNIPTITKTNIIGIKSEGYYVCHLHKIYAMTDSVTYHCAKGAHISLRYVCDQTIDCPNDNSDEQNCIFSIFPQKLNESYHFTAKNKCLVHYFTDMRGQCKQYSSKFIFEKKSIISSEMDSIRVSYFHCTGGQVIHPSLGK